MNKSFTVLAQVRIVKNSDLGLEKDEKMKR